MDFGGQVRVERIQDKDGQNVVHVHGDGVIEDEPEDSGTDNSNSNSNSNCTASNISNGSNSNISN
ncbi:hypothetical protein M5D96_005704, partial [Drosophila gunungcola]